MRLLAAPLALAVLLSGCLAATTPPLDPAALPGAASALTGPVVHRAGAIVQEAPEQVLGGLPRVVQKLLGVQGAEPNIGVTSSGSIFISAFDLVMRSRDLGDTWEQVYEFGSVHGPEGSGFLEDPVGNTDPMLWVDPVTDRIFAPGMWPPLVCAQGAWSDDDGDSWTDLPMRCGIPGGFDHQKLATGPYAEDSPLPRTGDYPNAVYMCYNNVRNLQASRTNCAVSTDGGMTYIVDQPVDGGCGGVNGHPATAPNGTVYVPYGVFSCMDTYVARSFDNGASWEPIKLRTNGLGSAEIDPEVAVTPDGTAYYLFRAATDHRVYLVRTTDAFDTIEGPWLVSPPDVLSTRFLAMAPGSDGRLAMAYLGTRDAAATPGEVKDDTRWHLFTTFTFDAASPEPTFVTVQVNPPEDPVQIGYSWERGGGDPGRNLLDFIDGVVGPDGRFHVTFTDGCTEGCAGNAGATKHDSRARDTALAVMVEGPSLLVEAPEGEQAPQDGPGRKAGERRGAA